MVENKKVVFSETNVRNPGVFQEFIVIRTSIPRLEKFINTVKYKQVLIKSSWKTKTHIDPKNLE